MTSRRRPSAPNPPLGYRRGTIKCEISYTTRILRALENEFDGRDIRRVAKSFRDVIAGNTIEHGIGTEKHFRASSSVQNLEAVPFYENFDDDKFAWVRHLEANWEIIRDELATVTGQENIAELGNNIWAPPVVEAANAYGPDWRTLVLQDREWDPINVKLFPKTTKLLRDDAMKVPCVEAFFARQSPGTGIKLHTDDCNFILTMHLSLSAPPNESWIEVAGERRYWSNGKSLVFNTSYFHQTMNESQTQDRVVLLIRFWHPQLTQVEREALSFLFQVVDDPDNHPAVLKAARELTSESVKGKKQVKPSGRGFGK